MLGVLGRRGWLDGLSTDDLADSEKQQQKSSQQKKSRRDVRLLEIGAINTQLLDAAARTRVERVTAIDDNKLDDEEKQNTINKVERVHRLHVKAIDLRSTNPRIEQRDFFELPLSEQPYDVLVNSMVINCVPSAPDRGRMLALLYHQLRPGGLCFLTLPRLCLNQSRYITMDLFKEMLTDGVGFELVRDRESPKVAFFVLKRPVEDIGADKPRSRRLNAKFTKKPIINKAKKYRNEFGVVLDEDEVNGKLF